MFDVSSRLIQVKKTNKKSLLVANSVPPPPAVPPTPPHEVCIAEMTPATLAELTKGAALELLTWRAGERFDVSGNGTCWMYAAMASLRISQHLNQNNPDGFRG